MLVPRSLPRFALRSLLKSYTCRVFLIFLIVYALAVYYARIHCWRDPTSFFFRDDEAYEPIYSDSRTEQANQFVELANNRTGVQQFKASHQPSMCVGVASVARNGVSYFESAVGSVLAGLSEAERADLYLILFIAHTDPTEHPAYSEPWLQALADKVLLYDKKEVDVDHIHSLETAEEKSFAREKGLFDYTYLLKACQSVNAPYSVILEDDIVALDSWYHRAKQAVAAAERQTKEQGAAKCKCQSVVLQSLFCLALIARANSATTPKGFIFDSSIRNSSWAGIRRSGLSTYSTLYYQYPLLRLRP